MVASSGPNASTATLCTATLIAPDLILTNSHCFDDTDLSPGDLCQTTKFIFADKSAGGPDRVACKEIVSKSTLIDGNFNQPDDMVIRLDHPLTRQAATVSRAGLRQHEVLTLHKIDADMKRGNGVVHVDHCEILQGTVFIPASLHDTDPVMITRDCDIRDGNSGSPLTDDKGQVAAIAFASVDHDPDIEKANAMRGDLIDEQAEKAKMAHVTNLACVDLPAPVAPVSAACIAATAASKTNPQMDGATAEAVPQMAPTIDLTANWPAIQGAATAAAQAHVGLLDPKLSYRAALTKDNASIIYVPYCFLSPANWLSQYQDDATSATIHSVK